MNKLNSIYSTSNHENIANLTTKYFRNLFHVKYFGSSKSSDLFLHQEIIDISKNNKIEYLLNLFLLLIIPNNFLWLSFVFYEKFNR